MRRGTAGLLGLALAVAVACAPAPGGGGGPSGPATWVIPAGSHDMLGATVSFTTSDLLALRVRFDASAEYATVDPANQADINKLRGFSDCSSHHQTDSARFGWRWMDGRIDLLAYDYVAGERQSQLLTTTSPGVWIDLRLEAVGATYLFTVNGVTTVMPRGCADSGLVKYDLWPYFGGDEVAPHEVRIEHEP